MASFWQKLFGGGRKPQTIAPEEPPRYGETFGGKKAYDILASMGSPESYANKYYDYAYQPTAAATRSNWEQYVKPGIMDESLMPRSTQTMNLLRRSVGERELELGKYGGELKARGYETGLGERTKQLGGYQKAAGVDIGQATLGQQQRYGEATRVEGAMADKATADRDRLLNILKTAGGTAMTLGGSDILNQLLNRGGGAVSSTGSGAVSSTGIGTDFSKRKYLNRDYYPY